MIDSRGSELDGGGGVKDYGFCTVSEPGGRYSPGVGPLSTHTVSLKKQTTYKPCLIF